MLAGTAVEPRRTVAAASGAVGPKTALGPQTNLGGSGSGFGEGELGLFEDVSRLANAIRWTGIGILTLAGAVLIFKLTDLILD